MKQYSQTRMFVTYIAIAFSMYLIMSACVAIIGEYNYRVVLTSPGQILAVLFIYWWTPIPTMIDMNEENELCTKFKTF